MIATVRRSIVLLMLIGLAVLLSVGQAMPGQYDIAVIIGNKDYEGTIPDVEFAHNDADAVRTMVIQVLGYPERNIIDLRNSRLSDLINVFGMKNSYKGQLFYWTRPNQSRILVYYSGHGVPGQQDRRGYLLPIDANPNRPELTGLSIDTLYENLRQVPATSITVLLDACFTGESQGGRLIDASPFGIEIDVPAIGNRFGVLTATGGGELAFWDTKAEQGLFTLYLLRGVYGLADQPPWGNGDGQVSLFEVATYLQDEMSYCARRNYMRDQTPTLHGQRNLILTSVSQRSVRNLPINSGLCLEPPVEDVGPESLLSPEMPVRATLAFSPPAALPSADEIEASIGITLSGWRLVQQALTSLGYNAGRADGVAGPQTRSAIERWQRAENREVVEYGYLSKAGHQALLGAARMARANSPLIDSPDLRRATVVRESRYERYSTLSGLMITELIGNSRDITSRFRESARKIARRSYARNKPQAEVVSGYSNRRGYYLLLLRAGPYSAFLELEGPAGPDGMSDTHSRLITSIACTAEYQGVRLGCPGY